MENFKEWMNSSLLGVAKDLEQSIAKAYHVEGGEGLTHAGREEIFTILDGILGVLFPGCFAAGRIPPEEMNFFLVENLRKVSFQFIKIIENTLDNYCQHKGRSHCSCKVRAEESLRVLIEQLPKIRKDLLKDIDTAYSGDPAAGSFDEIVLSYPFIDAIATHRIAHELYKQQIPIIPRIMSERAHSRTGIDIHPGADIQPGFFIDHGTGVVIGETCTIGKNVKLYQGVTLGATSPFDKEGNPRKGKRHPDIEDDVIIYANATILGGRTVIGRGSIIGGNTWITKSVPPNTTVITQRSDYC